MRMLCWALFLGLSLSIPSEAPAASELDDEAFSRAVEGTFILFQNDGFQRVLSFSRGGTVSQVSDQEQIYGYTSGLGAWTRTGADQIRARVIDYEFDLDTGTPSGVSRIDFVITLSKQAAAHYHELDGTFSVESYARGQNPLDPDEAAIRRTGDAFTGSRIVAPDER